MAVPRTGRDDDDHRPRQQNSSQGGALQRRPHVCFLELGVPQRRTDVAMTEHTLHDLDALALGDQIAAARMTQLVRCVAGNAAGIEEPSRRAQLGPLVVHRVV